MTTLPRDGRTDAARRFLHDLRTERRILLLHIAAACPRDTAELARRIARPETAIREELDALVSEGTVHVHGSAYRATGADRILAEADPAELRAIHRQVLDELEASATPRPAALIALAESGCREPALLRLLIACVEGHPESPTALGTLTSLARALGHDEDELRLLRAAEAAGRGRVEQVLQLTEGLITAAAPAARSRAAVLAASAHLRANRLQRATALYQHAGAEIGHDATWAVMAALGRGDLDTAVAWRATMDEVALSSRDAALADLADGLLRSVDGAGDGALDLLARSVSALSPFGEEVLLPDTPAALAAIVAISRGEPATADVLLDRARRSGLGGEPGRQRHLLISAWSLMVRGRLDAAERRLEEAGSRQGLCDRDLLLHWCLVAAIGRRRGDSSAMRSAWRELRDHTLGLELSLYDLLPLGEMMTVAAQVHDAARVRPLVEHAVAVLARLGDPPTWSAPLHWSGVQAAFHAADPAALIPHAQALTKAAQLSGHAAALARAGQTWLEVLRDEADLDSVRTGVRALAATGNTWDASRLAGQAALRRHEREDALELLQLAREVSREHQRSVHTPAKDSVLTARELDVGRLVLDGHGYRAIGEQLFISPKTVEHHVARIRHRLGATSRGELLAMLHEVIDEAGRGET